MLGLKPIQLLPARERVASALRKAIISKQISEGEVLALETTAQELGVSVTPVREAFQILSRDGLIDLKQNKGRSGSTIRSARRSRVRRAYFAVKMGWISMRSATVWSRRRKRSIRTMRGIIRIITSRFIMKSGRHQAMKN